MAQPGEPPPVKLICGMISSSRALLDLAARPLSRAFGPIDLVTDPMHFDLTDYYDAAMGSPLYRRFVSFERLVGPERLVEAKHTTNRIEADYAAERGDGDPERPINLDPGYVDPARLVLASMKDFSHRVYLGRGVHGEVTLIYRKGRWEPLPWTFPDFADDRYHGFLTEARERLREARRKGRPT